MHPIAGVGALILRENRILLVERGRDPLKGWWSIPGGRLEFGETLDQAVRREVLEETGLVIEPTSVLEIFERFIHGPDGQLEHHYVLVDYVCRVTGGELRAGDDASRVAWVRRDDLHTYRITEGTVPVIQKAFESAQAELLHE